MSKVIYRGVFGSHLYGTFNENSDRDERQIHQDSLENIILKKGSNVFSNHSNPSTKNTKDDLDFESTELREFVWKCLSGQSFALNLIFTPKHLWLESSDVWEELQENKHKLVTRNVNPFIGYCKSMCQKYSKKGDKLKELKKVYEIISKHSSKETLASIFSVDDVLDFEHISIQKKFNQSSKHHEDMLQVVDSFYPLHRQISEVLKSISGKIEAFGERSKKASEDGGIDLKAYYHAFRVCWELEELLIDGKLTFPSRYSGLMLEMRNGKYSHEHLDFWLETEIQRVLKIPNNLPEADHDFWNGWLLEKYLKRI